uniref:MRN complex-interacting protein N-terminal domain-containing protein n=1 Tax=Takifugu rubripes TaxID=31033 RepID=A0A674NA17_TAKRU
KCIVLYRIRVRGLGLRWECQFAAEDQQQIQNQRFTCVQEFGRGSSRDCRHHVQKLNSMRGAVMQEEESNPWSLW